MRTLLLALLVAGASMSAACNCTSRSATFFWMSRLVPVTPNDAIVTGTGLRDSGPMAAEPAPAPMTQPAM